MPPAIFQFSFFSGKVSHFCPESAWDYKKILLLMPSLGARITGTHHHAQFIDWDGVLQISYRGWSSPIILPISASQVAGITGVKCFTPSVFLF
jgi:hypothetical protein